MYGASHVNYPGGFGHDIEERACARPNDSSGRGQQRGRCGSSIGDIVRSPAAHPVLRLTFVIKSPGTPEHDDSEVVQLVERAAKATADWEPTNTSGAHTNHWTSTNVGEAAPGVLTPLAASHWLVRST
jgi:hypothetical protein